jgi:peptidoglycan hydrolase-like protein with peptidoglycan-binding domain
MSGEPTLKRGHNNPHEWVVYAQQLLNHALGGGMHLDVPENGVFDQAFEQEVVAFQSQHGLGHDGSIGPGTWAALHKAVDARQKAASAASAEEDDQLQSAPREVHSAPGHKDDEAFHERKDAHGNTVRVYDMDAEDISGSKNRTYTWNQAVAAMTALAVKNTEMQIPYVLVAVQEFQTSSMAQIDQFAQAARQFLDQSHVSFPWDLLVDGLEFGLSTVFEVPIATELGKWIYGKVKGALIGQLKAELEARANPVPGLEKRLEEGVAALVLHITQQTPRAVDDVKAAIPDYIREAMHEYQQVSDDYEWISAMVDYFGFPQRTTQNVTDPILQSLNEQFGAMIHQVEQEVLASS